MNENYHSDMTKVAMEKDEIGWLRKATMQLFGDNRSFGLACVAHVRGLCSRSMFAAYRAVVRNLFPDHRVRMRVGKTSILKRSGVPLARNKTTHKSQALRRSYRFGLTGFRIFMQNRQVNLCWQHQPISAIVLFF